MSQEEQKRATAEAALDYIADDSVIGVGTGSTVNFFIDALAERNRRVRGAVASSVATEQRLRAHQIPIVDLNHVTELAVYVDGADEATEARQLIKGGGGALTREKIVAAASRRFVCILDQSKLVSMLGAFPLPVEVIPMAQGHVSGQIAGLGGRPVLRDGFTTDNGNLILDIHDLKISEPVALERQLNDIAGVVCNGLFALRPADVLLVADDSGVKKQ